MSDQHRKKLSEAKKGKSFSNYIYKVIDPNGNEFLVKDISLDKFWKDTFKRGKPDIFKGITKTENLQIKVESGKFKGFELYAMPRVL